jgi:nitrate reductase NapD
VGVLPENAQSAKLELARIAGVEIHAATDCKIVVTLETDSEAELVTRLNEISLLDGVMSANLVFHHYEDASGD